MSMLSRLPPPLRLIVILVNVVIGLALLAVLALQALNTDPGRALLAEQVGRLVTPESGLRVSIGRVEGRPLSKVTARDIALSDTRGVFLTIPELALDWNPLAFARDRLVITSADAPTARLLRRPVLNPGDPDAPLLPTFDIELGRLSVGALTLEAPVAGRRQQVAIEAAGQSSRGRLLARGVALSTAGDRAQLMIDARPDDDRFDLDVAVAAPADGLVAGLTGIARPLVLTATGDGSWARWRGRAAARLGGAEVAALALTGADGRFTAAGTVTAAALLPAGPVARLAGVATAVEATLGPAGDDAWALTLAARNPALELRASGAAPRDLSRVDRFEAAGTLARADALIEGARGGPVAFAARASGPIGAPTVTVEASAAALGYASVGLSAPRLRLSGTLGPGPLVLATTLTAARATGLGAQLGPLVERLTVSGPIRIAGGVAASDRLIINTSRLSARATARLDLASGAYLVALDGRLPSYNVPGLGLADLTARLSVRPTPAGLAVAGPFTARVRRLDQAALRRLAGGLPVVTGQLVYAPDGRISATGVRFVAPRLTLAGAGSYAPGGAIRANASGRSTDYGPVTLAVAGTVAAPTLDLRLARPGLGLGLANLVASVRPAGAGYAVVARGRTDYGAFTADAVVTTAGGLAADIRSATLAGLTVRGRVAQGPRAFQGLLALSGPGITGELLLSEAEASQRAAISLVFAKAQLPALDAETTIGSGRAAAVVTLLPGGLAINGTAALAKITRGNLTIDTLSAQGGWRNNAGGVRLALAGEADAPFRLSAAIGATPGRITLTGGGQLADEPIALAAPAVITRGANGDWVLAPATLTIEDGRATLAGTYGRTTRVQATLADLSLDSLNAVGALDVRGTVSGTAALVLPPGSLPEGNTRFTIRRLSRAGIASASLPVEVEAAAAVRGGQAAARGFIRRQGRVLGSFQAQLPAIPGGAALTDRFLAAPLTGRLRVAAAAEALWPLTGVDAFDVRGPIQLSADLGGRLGAPLIRGVLRSNGASAESAALGAKLTNVVIDGVFEGPRLTIRKLDARAGDGTLAATGALAYTPAQGLTADVRASLANARLLATDTLTAAVTGPGRIQLDRSGGLISGDVAIDSARFNIGQVAAAEIPTLKVREIGVLPGDRRAAPVVESVYRLEANARTARRVEVRGMGLQSEWSAAIAVGGTATAPTLLGRADIIRGEYEFAGKSFRIERGRIRFQGENPPNPVVDIVAVARTSDLTAQINIRGTALAPEITFSSIPALPQDEVLSRLLFGTSIENLSAPEALQLAAAVGQLRGGSGDGLNPIAALRRATGLDRLRIGGGAEGTGAGTTVAAGKHIGRNLYLEIATDARGYTATQVELALTRWLSVLSSVATAGGSRVSVRVSRDY